MPKSKRTQTAKNSQLQAAYEGDQTPVLKIPTEIWREIVSGSNFLILQSDKDGIPRSLLLLSRSKISSCPKTIPPAYRERPETLRALSQTCRSLRTIFLPLLWERVEACFEPQTGAAWQSRVANVLLARCKGLMKHGNQGIADYVRVFSVSLSSHNITTVMPIFAQCLGSLPKLDTLHILHAKSKWEQIITNAFEEVELPNVQTIILPSYAHAILAACFNVRDVSCNEESGAKLFNTLVDSCPKVERIQGFEFTSARMKKLSKSLPKLREIAVPFDMNISSLSIFKRLSVIELMYDVDDSVSEDESESDGTEEDRVHPSTVRKQELLKEKCDTARAVLEGTTGKVPKRVKVSHWEEITGMLGMAEITYGRYWVKTEQFDL